MNDKKTINVALYAPQYQIGQLIHVPQRGGVVSQTIYGYDARICENDRKVPHLDGNPVNPKIAAAIPLIAGVTGYHISQFVHVRRGDDDIFTTVIERRDFLANKDRAQRASRFLEVKVEEETWKLAIGDRDEKEPDSKYNIENSNLPSCCANISAARDILLYCKKENGLLAHYRNELASLLRGHGFHYRKKSPIDEIFQQLGIRKIS